LLQAVRDLERLERADTLAELMKYDALAKPRVRRAAE
jgi:hypothetical protein